MRPIRGEQQRHVSHNPWNGREQPLGQQETIHILTDSGSIESYTVHHHVALSCGCLNQAVGGVCGECQQSVCTHHYFLCIDCHKPLCARHTIIAPKTHEPVCSSCHRIRRRRGWIRSFLSIFVEFHE